MDDAILQRLLQVDLGVHETKCTALVSEDIQEGLLDEDLSIVAKLHGGMTFNLEGFRTAMGKA